MYIIQQIIETMKMADFETRRVFTRIFFTISIPTPEVGPTCHLKIYYFHLL